MPIQKSHLLTILLVSSSWGHSLGHFNRGQDSVLHARNADNPGEFYPAVLQKREAFPVDESNETADVTNQSKDPKGSQAKPTDTSEGTDKRTTEKPPTKVNPGTTPALTPETTKPPTQVNSGGKPNPEKGQSPPVVDKDKIKEKLVEHRKKFDQHIAELRKKVDAKIKQAENKNIEPIKSTPPTESDA